MPTLHIARVKLDWRIANADPRWHEFMAAYGPYCDNGPGHLVIQINVPSTAPAANYSPLPNSLIRERRIRGRDFTLGDSLITGRAVSPDHIECSIHPRLLTGTGLRVLEHFFYLLFYHAVRLNEDHQPNAPFLLHSSGVLHDGQAHVFCGPSGSGKSTAATLCPARPLLSDETLAFSENRGTSRVASTPINPFCIEKTNAQGDLAGLYLIEHGAHHTISPINRQEAVPRLIPEVILPLGLFETDLGTGMARSLDHALWLYRTGCVKKLAFRPDPGFWNLILETTSFEPVLQAGPTTDTE
jgi:hypothetical protein